MIHEHISFEQYQGLDGVNWSTLKHLRKSPLHYIGALLNDGATSPSMALGTAAHMATLEPMRFSAEVVVYADGIRRGKAWDAFALEHAGSLILKPDEYQRAQSIARAVRLHPVSGPILHESGAAEVSLTWTDSGTGIDCKCRIDWLTQACVMDLKSARDVDPRLFGMAAEKLGYAHQMAFQLRGARENGLGGLTAYLCAVESERPHDVIVYRVTGVELETADAEIDALLSRLRDCLDRSHWPGQSERVIDLTMPRWFYVDDEDGDTDGLVWGGDR